MTRTDPAYAQPPAAPAPPVPPTAPAPAPTPAPAPRPAPPTAPTPPNPASPTTPIAGPPFAEANTHLQHGELVEHPAHPGPHNFIGFKRDDQGGWDKNVALIVPDGEPPTRSIEVPYGELRRAPQAGATAPAPAPGVVAPAVPATPANR